MDDATQILFKQILDGQTSLSKDLTNGFKEHGERLAKIETHMESAKEWTDWRKDTDTRVGKLEKYQTKAALLVTLLVAAITAAWQWILHKA